MWQESRCRLPGGRSAGAASSQRLLGLPPAWRPRSRRKEVGAAGPFKAKTKMVDKTGKNRVCKKFDCEGKGKHCTVRGGGGVNELFICSCFLRVGETCPPDLAQWTVCQPED